MFSRDEFIKRIHSEVDKLPDDALLDTLLYVVENQQLFTVRKPRVQNIRQVLFTILHDFSDDDLLTLLTGLIKDKRRHGRALHTGEFHCG